VGLVGCGTISGTYLTILPRFQNLSVVACADIDMKRAQHQAKQFSIPHACSVDELLAMPEVEIVVNLTIPRVHGKVALQALSAGKSIYNEKPLAVTREDGLKILRLAKRKGLLVGGAPDTFLGGGLQTCRRLIDKGAIGEPVAAAGSMLVRGHESWHPDPAFYYQAGGGPMFDMGPYYLTAMVSLLGPVRRVTAATRATFRERIITSQPRAGEKIPVRTPTHIAGVMEFSSGVIGTLLTSFDVWASRDVPLQVYGTEGSMMLPDPNGFGGDVLVWRPERPEWVRQPLTHLYTDQWRGVGVADMARALRTGRPHRASGALAYHVLDVMHAFHDASRTGAHVRLKSKCDRPKPMPVNLPEGKLD
jgi:predicted dehydrogenase